MQAWVAGATGLVGGSLLKLLLADGRVEGVTALVRRQVLPEHPKLEQLVVDFDELAPSLSGRAASHGFSCLGTTMGKAKTKEAFRRVDFDYSLEFGRAAKQAGARSVLSVSSTGANPSSRVFYNRVKGELEQALGELGLPTLHLLRPSLLDGERHEMRAGERLALTVARPLAKLLVGPLEKYRPIAAGVVAKAMLCLAFDPKQGHFIHESDEIARYGR